MTTTARRFSWLALAAVVAATLAIGATGDRTPRTEAERVDAIASGVRCPTCRSLSAAESDAVAARAVRDAIRDGIRDGRSDEEIRAFLVSRYGEEILLKPRASGLSGLVWALPVVALAIGFVVIGVAFGTWRRRREDVDAPTDDDRVLVERALAQAADE